MHISNETRLLVIPFFWRRKHFLCHSGHGTGWDGDGTGPYFTGCREWEKIKDEKKITKKGSKGRKEKEAEASRQKRVAEPEESHGRSAFDIYIYMCKYTYCSLVCFLIWSRFFLNQRKKTLSRYIYKSFDSLQELYNVKSYK